MKKKYDKIFKLSYDDQGRRWMLGPFYTSIMMAPALGVNGSHNINSLTITVVNRNDCKDYQNFAMGFDSIGYSENGKPILYAKFSDAYDQLVKNMENLEKFLGASIDISVLKDKRPMILEFERRADGKSPWFFLQKQRSWENPPRWCGSGQILDLLYISRDH